MTFQLAVRLKYMKDNGRKLISQAKYEKWIEDNIDSLMVNLSHTKSLHATRKGRRGSIEQLLEGNTGCVHENNFKRNVMDFVESKLSNMNKRKRFK